MNTNQWLVAGALALATIQVQAGNSPENKSLNKALRKEIQYPVFAKKDQIQGMVGVKYEVQPNGSISILEMNGSHTELEAYVREKLEGVIINDRSAEGIHYAKFVFRYMNM